MLSIPVVLTVVVLSAQPTGHLIEVPNTENVSAVVGSDEFTRLALTDRSQVVAVTAEGLRQLALAGVESRQLLAPGEAPDGEDLFLAMPLDGKQDGDSDILAREGRVLSEDGHGYLVLAAGDLPERQFSPRFEYCHIPWSGTPPRADHDRRPGGGEPRPLLVRNALVDTILSRITKEELAAAIDQLSGEVGVTIGGQPDTITTRWAWAEDNSQAVRWCKEQFESYSGLDSVDFHHFLWVRNNLTYNDSNVVATKLGTVHPHRYAVFGGHIDCRSESSYVRAPGADDDGTGTVTAMLAAKYLGDIPLKNTVEFVAWNAEELGLRGSRVHAREAYDRGDTIIGVLNTDMIASDTTGDHALKVYTGPRESSVALGQLIVDVNETYDLGLEVLPNDSLKAWSDHYWYYYYEYDAIHAFERDFCPDYHSMLDRITQPWFDTLYFTKAAKAMIAALIELAELDTVLVDAGPVAILVPSGVIDTGSVVTPRVVVRNYGFLPVDFEVVLETDDGYVDTASVFALAGGADDTVSFDDWTARYLGRFGARSRTLLPGDMVTGNDAVNDSFTVIWRHEWPSGWHEVASMPSAPSGQPVKRGAWLAVDAASGLVYAAKGNKTTDFYRFSPEANNWAVLTGMPYQSHPLWNGKPPRKGARGICDGDGSVFVTQGNNTLAFWRYDIEGDSWSILPDVPAGPSGKKVKGGTDMVYLPGYVYLLKGYRSEFYRYDIAADQWEQLPDAPAGARAKWDKGSWLAYDGLVTIYAHKAKYHELWEYDVLPNEWDTDQQPGMPLQGMQGRRKKSKDGGSAAWFGDGIFALKGGNTQEFWFYDDVGFLWFERDTIPQFGSTGRKKRVKHGADLTLYRDGVFFALKGNKTLEFWRYVIPAAKSEEPANPGSAAGPADSLPGTGIRVAPNPLGPGRATLFYSLPSPGPVSVRVFEVSGRAVLQRRLAADRSRGEVALATSELAAGVYLVRVESPGFRATEKLVIGR